MIRWQSAQSNFVSFSYYPMLEICVGIFLIIVAVTVPTLFAKYNGFKLSQLGEWIGCIVFMLFFIMLGKSLAFQKMKVTLIQNSKICFFQNMRTPEVSQDMQMTDFNLVIEKDQWQSSKVSVEAATQNEKFYVLWLNIDQKLYEFYRSVNKSEVNQMLIALEKLKNKSEE